MTETALEPGASSRELPARDPVTPILFAVAIFTSAALVFVVQPMVTKLVLPMLGGSPSVWNTAMVFFQAALLGGYAYAHVLQRVGSMRAQLAIHLGLLLAAALFLPLRISGVLGDPDPNAPIGWLLATLGLSVGAPFAVLSATAPLLQAWYARVRVGHADGQNPYVLYTASNLGSFLALLAYPILIEPLLSLSGQRVGWSGGYGVFMLLIVGLATVVWQRRVSTQAEPPRLVTSPRIDWRRKGILVLLAAAPSSLMLGVTAHLSTDVASAPFLWVAPLALYLLTFVIAFQARPWIPLPITLVIAAALAAVTSAMLPFRTGEWGVIFALHLVTFFFVALMCHQLLAARRPAPDRLTEFYLLLSLGGVVGGAFTALLAPVIFQTVWEYPLVLVLVGLARPTLNEPPSKSTIVLFVAALVVCATPPLLAAMFDADWDLAWAFNRLVPWRMEQLTQYVLGMCAILAFLLRDRRILFTVVVAAMAVSAHTIARGYDWALTERSFFGVMRVAPSPDPRMGGAVNVLMHGTTLHGAQARDPRFACIPTLYYAPMTPIGQATTMVQDRGPAATIGVVGQGSGAMAGYKRAGDTLTFFEIDPMVDRLSRDPEWFSYIDGCADGPVRTVLGDARLTMADETPGSYDLLLIDAFSSDAVPTHLLTVEAIAGYLALLKPDGVVVLHLSNRNLDITRPAVAAARALGMPDLHQIYIENPDAADMAEASTEALIISPTEAGLAAFRADPRWRMVDPQGVRPWTDDYVDLFGSLVRQVPESALKALGKVAMHETVSPALGLNLGSLFAATCTRARVAWRGAAGVLLAWAVAAVLMSWTSGLAGLGLGLLSIALGLAACGAVLRLGLTDTLADARAIGMGPAGFQLGRAELRLLGAGLLCAIFLAMVVSILVLVLLAVFGLSELDPVAIRAGDASAVGPLWKLVVMALVAAGVVVLPVMLATRLSLFAPATVAQGRMVSLLVMGISRGSVWPLFLGLAACALPTVILIALVVAAGLGPAPATSVVTAFAVLIQVPSTLVLLAVAYRHLDPDARATRSTG